MSIKYYLIVHRMQIFFYKISTGKLV